MIMTSQKVSDAGGGVGLFIWFFFAYGVSFWAALSTLTALDLKRDITSVGVTKFEMKAAFRAMEQDHRLAEAAQEFQKAIHDLRMEIHRLESASEKALGILLATDRSEQSLGRDKKGLETMRPDESRVTEKSERKIEKLERKKEELARKEQLLEEMRKQREDHRNGSLRYLSDPAQSTRLIQLATDLKHLESPVYAQMVHWPALLLTLILAISMGVVGSVISLTWEFFDKKSEKRYSYFFFRPLLGGVLAFTVFVLLKSGQMFLAGAPASDALKGDLNPFFISFAAIVSGMLAQQAYERIRSAGSHLLSVPPQQTRRYVRASVLREAIEAQEKDPLDLASYVNETEPRVEAWFSEKDPVDEANQTIIAAWLGLSPRELFTDQAPDKEKKGTPSVAEGKGSRGT